MLSAKSVASPRISQAQKDVSISRWLHESSSQKQRQRVFLYAGNDLARCLGWGGGLQAILQKGMQSLLRDIELNAIVSLLDRWNVVIQPLPASSSPPKGKLKLMTGFTQHDSPQVSMICTQHAPCSIVMSNNLALLSCWAIEKMGTCNSMSDHRQIWIWAISLGIMNQNLVPPCTADNCHLCCFCNVSQPPILKQRNWPSAGVAACAQAFITCSSYNGVVSFSWTWENRSPSPIMCTFEFHFLPGRQRQVWPGLGSDQWPASSVPALRTATLTLARIRHKCRLHIWTQGFHAFHSSIGPVSYRPFSEDLSLAGFHQANEQLPGDRGGRQGSFGFSRAERLLSPVVQKPNGQ